MAHQLVKIKIRGVGAGRMCVRPHRMPKAPKLAKIKAKVNGNGKI